MACLILFPDDPAKQSIHFLKASANAIGTDESNHIKLQDPSLSPFHALITSQHRGEYCEIIDLHSQSGTSVNGTPILRCILKHSDRISLGSIPAAYYKIPPERSFRSGLQGIIPPLDQEVTENLTFITTPVDGPASSSLTHPDRDFGGLNAKTLPRMPQISPPPLAAKDTTSRVSATPRQDEIQAQEQKLDELRRSIQKLQQDFDALETSCLSLGLGPDANQTRHCPETSALMLFCFELIRAIDMFESFKKHSIEAKLPKSILDQFDLYQANLFKILERRSVRTITIPEGSVVDVQMRHKIIVIDRVEQGRSEHEPPKVLETLRPGYIYSDGQTQDIVLRKPEVVITA